MKNFLSTLFLLPWFALQAAVPSTLNEALIIPDDTLQCDQAGRFIADCILHTDDWNSYREKLRNNWMSIIGEWPNVISGKKLQHIGEPERLDNGIDRYRVSLEWLPDVITEGYLLIPGNRGIKPAVITFFYEPETSVGIGGKPCRDFALQLARCGFVTLSLGSTETTETKTYGIYYPSIDNPVMESLSAMAYAAANAYEALALETEVDADRIGIMGHSYGGKWAMFASCLYDKFACAAWGDPGIVLDETKGGYINYWEPWYLGWRPRPWSDTWNPEGYERPYGAYKKLKEEGRDLYELQALMAPRPFLVSGGFADSEDRYPVLNSLAMLYHRLGVAPSIYFTRRPSHDPDEDSNRLIQEFFKFYLMDR